MQFLASIFVGQPVHIFLVAFLWGVGYLLLRKLSPDHGFKALLIAGLTWGLYGCWEWLVVYRTPEANIRIDLLLIWPLIGVVSIWAILMTVWQLVRRGRTTEPH